MLDVITLAESEETFLQQMNKVDLERLKERKTPQSKSLIACRESFSSSSTASFTLSASNRNIDLRLKELKQSPEVRLSQQELRM
jgi:hypothetical protein